MQKRRRIPPGCHGKPTLAPPERWGPTQVVPRTADDRGQIPRVLATGLRHEWSREGSLVRVQREPRRALAGQCRAAALGPRDGLGWPDGADQRASEGDL